MVKLQVSLPESIVKIATDAVKAHPSDIDAAWSQAWKKWRANQGYDQLREDLSKLALRQLIYDERHRSNRAAMKAAGAYNIAPKVGSESLNVIAESVLLDTFYIRGIVLRDCTGQHLRDASKREKADARGHLRVAYFCDKICEHVAPEEIVGEVIDGATANQLMQQAEQEAAAATPINEVDGEAA